MSGLCYGSSVCFLEGHPGVASVVEFWVRFGLPFEVVVIFWLVLEMSSRGGECVGFSVFLGSLEVLILLCGCRNISAVAAGDI